MRLRSPLLRGNVIELQRGRGRIGERASVTGNCRPVITWYGPVTVLAPHKVLAKPVSAVKLKITWPLTTLMPTLGTPAGTLKC